MASSVDKKVALVTGANKGIGFAIVQVLCERLSSYEWDVYLTARDPQRGLAAIEQLKQIGHQPHFHQLAIDDENSRKSLVNHLKSKYQSDQCIDILINNAGIAFKVDSPVPQAQQAVETVAINFTATKALCDDLFPLLKPHARVVNVSTSLAMLSNIPSSKIRERLADDSMTMEQLLELVDEYLTDAKEGKMQERGWGSNCYAVSKVFRTKMTLIQQKTFDRDRPNDDIIVNAGDPGYVATDMSSFKGPKTPREGAQALVPLALLEWDNPSNPKGQMFTGNDEWVDWSSLSDEPTTQ